MLKTTKLLAITVPKTIYREIRGEAKRRGTTVSGLMRTAFLSFVEKDDTLYSDKEIVRFLERDAISPTLRKALDKRLGR